MVKIVVNPGRKVWDRENRREAKPGEIVEVKPVEAKILKFRGLASDAPPPAPPRPVPPPPAPPPTPTVPRQAETRVVPAAASDDEEQLPRGRATYRRRDLRPED